MARVSIALPETFAFATEVDVLIQHINRGNHLANENLIALLNEARMRYIDSLDFSQSDTDPRAFINADLAVIYKAEAKHRDRLKIEVAANDFNQYGCDIVYRVSRPADGQLIAIAKMAMLSFDYPNNCLKPVGENFPRLFSGKTA